MHHGSQYDLSDSMSEARYRLVKAFNDSVEAKNAETFKKAPEVQALIDLIGKEETDRVLDNYQDWPDDFEGTSLAKALADTPILKGKDVPGGCGAPLDAKRIELMNAAWYVSDWDSDANEAAVKAFTEASLTVETEEALDALADAYIAAVSPVAVTA